MCYIVNKHKGIKPVTGYKVVIQVGKRYYSPFSGLQYKKGKVPIVEYKRIRKSKHSIKGLVWENLMRGRTGVILGKSKAVNYFHDQSNKQFSNPSNGKWAILEMTIKGSMWDAEFMDKLTVIGKEIVSFRKIK